VAKASFPINFLDPSVETDGNFIRAKFFAKTDGNFIQIEFFDKTDSNLYFSKTDSMNMFYFILSVFPFAFLKNSLKASLF